MLAAIKRLFIRSQQPNDPILGVQITPVGLGCVLLSDKGGGRHISACEFLACDVDARQQTLKTFCESQDISRLPVCVAFHPHLYSLILIDAPEVPDSELSEAVKWRINDMVGGKVENYVVDAFKLPADAYRGRMNMIYAAYIEKPLVQSTVAMCESLGLQLMTMGISELSRIKLLQTDETLENLGVAIISLEEKQGQIDVFENGQLYLSRSIELGYSMLRSQAENDGELTLDTDSQIERLTLDIQRSMDYYESQLGKSGVSRLYLVATEPLGESITEQLSQRLSVTVETLNLAMNDTDELPNTTNLDAYTVATGAALGGMHGGAH